MGVLLLKKWRKSAIFLCIFACDGCFGVSFVAVYVGWGCGGVLLWLVVSFLCDVVGAGGFSGNRVSSCS